MSSFVLGTAGHIDHGKTALVTYLSGVNTDTLKEEQKRGITVNLGFTYFDLDGTEIGVIDVPGHEKLIKNMLAGVFGIDLVLLVVAANDGIMPQTREHYEIIKFLGIKNVLTIITKTDLVDPERIQEVKEQVQNEFGLSDFAEFSIYGDTNVKEKIKEYIALDKEEDVEESFRMPIDRVFSVKGVGTVITGTSLSGEVKVGDQLEIFPNKELVKVKGIQVHKKPTDKAEKHSRVALNINKADLRRGKIIATPNSLQATKILDCKVTMGSGNYSLKHLEHIKFYYFTEETTARIKLFNKKELLPNETAYCQLLLVDELYAAKEDKAIIRKVNPNITVAGVEVLNELGEYANRKDISYEERIEKYALGESDSILLDLLKSNTLVHTEDLRKKELDINDIPDSEYVRIENYYIHNSNLCELEEKTVIYLNEFHEANKYVNGMNKAELKTRLGLNVKSRVLNGILDLFDEVEYKDIVKLKSFEIALTEEEQKLKNRILDYLGTNFKPPKYNDIYMYFQSREFENVFFSLVKKGEIIKIDDDIYLSQKQLERMKEILTNFFNTNTILDLGDARNLLDSSRRYVVPYLEYLDKIGFTSRKENGRVKR